MLNSPTDRPKLAVTSIPIGEVKSNFDGFSKLSEVAKTIETCTFRKIVVDMSGAGWFDANMCAPFGAILYKASRLLNTVSIEHMTDGVRDILSKNEFLSSYGGQARPDKYGTTIPYQRFETRDEKFFAAYVSRHMVGKGIPHMSKGLEKKFQESIFEIFSNSATHSETDLGIFACGQYFPNNHRLDLSLSDLGIGIRERIRRSIGEELPGCEAIKWALTGRNTTKSGPVPGGLGLKLLWEFIELNGGCLQIISDDGFWQTRGGEVVLKVLPHAFPGTAVNIEVNTADTKSYCLASELSPDEVF